MAKRTLFKETFPDSQDAPERKVLRTHVEFFYGIWEILVGMSDQAFTLDRVEELLSMGRRGALQLLKDALQSRGNRLQEIDPHEAIDQTDFVVDGKPITMKTFVGLLTDHVKKLFPELVSD